MVRIHIFTAKIQVQSFVGELRSWKMFSVVEKRMLRILFEGIQLVGDRARPGSVYPLSLFLWLGTFKLNILLSTQSIWHSSDYLGVFWCGVNGPSDLIRLSSSWGLSNFSYSLVKGGINEIWAWGFFGQHLEATQRPASSQPRRP